MTSGGDGLTAGVSPRVVSGSRDLTSSKEQSGRRAPIGQDGQPPARLRTAGGDACVPSPDGSRGKGGGLEMPPPPEAAFYSTAAVSKRTGASCHARRVWERLSGSPAPPRPPSGHRRYSRQQV